VTACASLRFEERAADGCAITLEVAHFVTGRTELQQYALLETPAYGKVLVIDGTIQVTELDAFVYHEALVWLPLLHHPNPQHVLIAGGASGYAAVTALAFPTVASVTQVEIDPQVLVAASRFFGNDWVWRDGRMALHADDIYRWLRAYTGPAFDAIILDLTDPDNPRTSQPCASADFYALTAAHLAPGGLLATQAGSAWFLREDLRRAYNLARGQFRQVRAFLADDALARGAYAFVLAGETLAEAPCHPVPPAARFLTEAYARTAFALPPYVAECLCS